MVTQPRIVLIGAGGQLATDLLPLLPGDVHALAHADIEITRADDVERVLDAVRPDIVINTAAYNLVDKAEADPEAAFAVNALGVRNLARACGSRGIVLMHISTDYVFGLDDTRRCPYQTTDLPGPLCAYGQSKLVGEQFVQALCPQHYVVRTCGLYGRSQTKAKGNFVTTMQRLAQERSELRVVADQICTPTWTRDLAPILASLLQSRRFGLYHATNSGQTTWHGLASEVVRLSGLTTKVLPITTAEYGAAARRPAYSVLDCSSTVAATGLVLRPWQEAIAEFLAESFST